MVVFSLLAHERAPRHRRTCTLDNYVSFFTNPTYVRTLFKTLADRRGGDRHLALAIAFAYFLARYVSRRWQRFALLVDHRPVLDELPAARVLVAGDPRRTGCAQPVPHGDRADLRAIAAVRLQRRRHVHRPRLRVRPVRGAGVVRVAGEVRFRPARAAQDLGARPDQAFRRILLPQIRPGIVTACIFVFIPILGEFLTPSMVGGAGAPDRQPRGQLLQERVGPRGRGVAS